MAYIYSTLACNQEYTSWTIHKLGVEVKAIPGDSVVIKGGAGLANNNLQTQHGVVTHVTDDQLALLKTIDAFNKHVELGYLVIDDKKSDAEVVAADMARTDKSRPLTPQEYDLGSDRIADNRGRGRGKAPTNPSQE